MQNKRITTQGFRRTSILTFILYALMLVGMAPCYAENTFEVVDYQNNKITLAKPATRIIALAPHIVENIFSAGLGDKLLGVVDHSDYPESAKSLMRIGSSAGVSLEKILSLKPDLVIHWRGGSDPKIMRRLIQLGIPVYADDPQTLSDISRSIMDYATLGDTTEHAQKQLATFNSTLEALKLKHHPQHTQRQALKVFHQIWHQPLRTLNGQHFVTDVIELCGGENIFAEEESIAPIVSLEALIAENPDVILIGTKNFDALQPPPRWLTMAELWATQQRQHYAINPDWLHRPTLRTALAAEAICRHFQNATPKPRATKKLPTPISALTPSTLKPSAKLRKEITAK